MEAMERHEEKMSREQQVKIMGMLEELRDKADKESFRSRISYRTCKGGLSAHHIYEWSEGMIKKLEEIRDLARV